MYTGLDGAFPSLTEGVPQAEVYWMPLPQVI
jgi:hypothetical protein